MRCLAPCVRPHRYFLRVGDGLCLVCVLILAGSLNLTEIVNAQAGGKGFFEWFWLPLLPVFVIYFISGVAETNRAPFDMAEGESEIVAGFHVEYSGSAFALFFLAEYANMILVSFLAAIFFLGGWLSPLQGWVQLDGPAWSTGSGPGVGRGCSSRRFWCRFCFCGFARRSRAIAMTRSCGLAGRSSFPSPLPGCWSAGCMRYFDWSALARGRKSEDETHNGLLQESAADRTVSGHGPDPALHVQTRIHRALSDGAHSQVEPLPRLAGVAPVREWRGTLHCLQTVRGGVSGIGDHHRFGAARGDGQRRTTRFDIDLFKCIYCGFCEEACPVDSIVLTSIHEYHFEHRGENVVNKQQLLAIGDRFEGRDRR